MLRKVLETPWNFDENAYSKNSHDDNSVLTEPISSKFHGDYRYFSELREGTAKQPCASCYAGLRSAASQSYTQSYTQCCYVELLRGATLCSIKLRSATQSCIELRRATLCYAMLCYAVLCCATQCLAELRSAAMRIYVQVRRPTLCFAMPG